jgi:hypothetical protein
MNMEDLSIFCSFLLFLSSMVCSCPCVAGRQGEGREVMRNKEGDNECNSEIKKMDFRNDT